MNKLLLTKILFLSVTYSLFGQANEVVDCSYPSEKISIDPIHPKRIEKYDPSVAKIFVFEDDFRDTISILVANNLILKKYMESDAEGGFADRVPVKVRPKTEIIIGTEKRGCTRFKLKKGYKYVYIQRHYDGQWSIAYSNFGRKYW